LVFSGFGFVFVFTPLLLAVYYLLPARQRAWRNAALLLFSLSFYAYGGLRYLPVMLASIAANYLGGLLAEPGARRSTGFRKAALALTVAVNLAVLGYFKYAGFFTENLSRLGLPVPVLRVALPIGISFFTFQGMSYAIDVYRADVPAQRNPFYVALYISLFPQLVAGPIVRYRDVSQALLHRRESFDTFVRGIERFIIGLSKKMLLANSLGAIADGAFSVPAARLESALCWLGALAYAGQIYFDFSGYSDMAVGLGRMFGFEFMENFNYPYIARTVTDFWRRWHISLSSWFRDYLYIPLGGSRAGKRAHVRNLLVVWALTGFWHGAQWSFLLWGLWFALLLLIERRARLFAAPADTREAKGRRRARTLVSVALHIYTMLAVTLGWVLFRADGAAHAASYAAAMFGAAPGGFASSSALYYLVEYRWELVCAVVAALPAAPAIGRALSAREGSPVAAFLLSWGRRGLLLLLFALCVLRLVSSGYNPFIYFNF
jgi:alginate O-acetyltransferase complex protein AlgI